MAMSAKVEELIKKLRDAGVVGDPATGLSKAKMSAANMANLKMAKSHMAKTGGHLEKAAQSHADDEDISNASAHHAAAMSYMDKVDVGLTDDRLHGETEDTGNPPTADAMRASATIEDLKKSLREEFTKALGEVKDQLAESLKKNEALALENAELKGRVKTLGAMPAPARVMTFMPARGAEAAANAGVNKADEIDPDKLDPNDPTSFRKALTVARQHPRSITDPNFRGTATRAAS